MSSLFLYQVALGFIGLVAILSGLRGVIVGAGLVGAKPADDPIGDNDVRYYSAIWAGLGVVLCSLIPQVREAGAQLTALWAVIIAGGVVRLVAVLRHGGFQGHVRVAMALELVGAPLLLWWQRVLDAA